MLLNQSVLCLDMSFWTTCVELVFESFFFFFACFLVFVILIVLG